MRAPGAPRRVDAIFLLILLAALVLRLYLATVQPYVHDEINTAIPLSRTISLDPATLNLPLRGENHGALPAYVVKASSTFFGTTPRAYRSMHLLLGLCTLVMVYALTRGAFGVLAARWAAALLAFNEYYLAVSSRATAHVPYLFFIVSAVYAFSRFLTTGRAAYAYAAGAATGLAFYCKEHSVLLLPVFALVLLHTPYRHWWRRAPIYLAALIFAAVVIPDIYWNATTDRSTARATYSTEPIGYSTYSSHLERIGGIGLSPYPAMFYAQRVVASMHARLTGRELRNETPEYPSMNAALGVLLLGGVLVTTSRRSARDGLAVLLLVMFWTIFLFFTLIRPGNPPGRLDPVSWIWVEATMIPAVMLTGARLAEATGGWRTALWGLAGALLLYASSGASSGIVITLLRGTRASALAGRSSLDDVATATVAAVRESPLRALAVAAAVGVALGFIVGALGGWFVRGRRERGRS